MLIDKMDFANIEKKEWDEDKGGWKLCRVNDKVLSGLNNGAKIAAYNTCGVELRFFMKSDVVRIKFIRNETFANTSGSNAGIAIIYLGDIQAPYQLSVQIITNQESSIVLNKKFLFNNDLKKKSSNFNPNLVRIILPYDCAHLYVGMDGEVETPTKADYPSKKILYYGSSITHGGSATVPTNSYVFQLSQMLKMDYRNLGFAGSNFLDISMAHDIKNEKWENCILELGINVLNNWDCEKFSRHVEQFLEIVSNTKNEGKIFCIGIFRQERDIHLDKKIDAYRKILKKWSSKHPRMIYLDGYDLLSECNGLSLDGIHPSDTGMTKIASNLFGQMLQFID
jgi:hypothetical protein